MAQISTEGEEMQLYRQLYNRIKKGIQKPTKQGTATTTKADCLQSSGRNSENPWRYPDPWDLGLMWPVY